MRIFPGKRSSVFLVVAAAAVPRLIVLFAERGNILSAYVEKSDDFARTFVASGTFGFVAGHPSADTQPLYGYFLIPLYWIFGRSWEVVGLAQIAVAAGTAVLVYAIGLLTLRRLALFAAVAATWNPYLIWHDVHVNREICDQFVLAALVLSVVVAVRRKTIGSAALVGAITGVAILGNSRLALLPLVLAVFLLASRFARPAVAVVVVLLCAAVVVSPWVIRNKVSVGCFAITTDGRALWKANNANTYSTLARGQWIDDVPQPKSFPPSAQDAAAIYAATGRYPHIDECTQMTTFEHRAERYVEHHPGGKLKLMGQAASLLWDPRAHETQGRPGKGTWRDTARRVGEPVWAVPIMALAIVGVFFAADRTFVALALVLLAYNTLAAMAFAGTTRYRVAFDFLLVLLACGAVEGLWRRLRYTRSVPATAASGEN